MGAKALFAADSSGRDNRSPLPGGERRLDIPVYAEAGGMVEAGRIWERSVWQDAAVLIAECPAPRLAPSIAAALRTVAVSLARDRGWQGLGTVSFSLDSDSGQFRVMQVQRPCRYAGARPTLEPLAPHVLDLQIGARRGHAPAAHLLVCGSTRGDALRRAYFAVARMRALPAGERALLLARLNSPAYCAGVTGARLALAYAESRLRARR
ncbi:BPTD_3102 family carboxylase-like protein [Bordetella sp. 2513F-2]